MSYIQQRYGLYISLHTKTFFVAKFVTSKPTETLARRLQSIAGLNLSDAVQRGTFNRSRPSDPNAIAQTQGEDANASPVENCCACLGGFGHHNFRSIGADDTGAGLNTRTRRRVTGRHRAVHGNFGSVRQLLVSGYVPRRQPV